GEFGRAAGAAHVAGEALALGVDGFEGLLDFVGSRFLVQVAEHEDGRLQQGRGIGDVFTRDVGRRSVDGFEDGAVVAEIRSGHQPQAADKGGAEVADDVAVEVFEQQRVVLERVHDELHAGVVNDVLGVLDVVELFRHFARATQEEPVGELHDVGLVNGMDLLAAVLARVFKGEAGDTGGALLGDDLDGFDHAGDDFMLQADVFAFSVFADDDQVHAGPMRVQAGKQLDGTEVREQVEFFAQGDVDALESATDGGGDRSFQRYLVLFDRVVEG